MYVLLFNLRHVIHILSFRMVNLLCYGSHFSNITIFAAKTKNRSPYLLEVLQPYLQNHLGTSLGRPQDICRIRSLQVNIRPYGDVVITAAETSLRRRQGTPHGVAYRTVRGRPKDVTLGCPQDVIFQRAKEVGRGRPQDVARGRPLQLHRGPYGEVLRKSLGGNFAEWEVLMLGLDFLFV